MNELLILFILKINNANIYEIRKQINVLFAPFIQVSTGAIIPTLKRLEEKGYVKSEKSISDGGLKKTIYNLLPSGEEYFTSIIDTGINAAPQILRRDIETMFMMLNHKCLSEQQNSLIIEHLKEAIKANIKQLEQAIKNDIMNTDFSKHELTCMETKLKILNNSF